MRHEQNTRLKIVRLMEPALCLSCNQSTIAEVEMENGTSRRMLHCRRLDCDNWETEEVPDIPKAIRAESAES